MTSVINARFSSDGRLGPASVTLGVTLSLLAWMLSGRGVAVPVVAVAILSILAGLVDLQTRRIPNHLVGRGLSALAIGAVVTAVGDHRAVTQIAGTALVGLIASGALLLGLMWFVRPASVGAGDVKLLAVQGATIGLVAPFAAPLILLGGTLGGLVQSTVLGRRCHVPLAPGLAVGFIVAAVVGARFNLALGGSYS